MEVDGGVASRTSFQWQARAFEEQTLQSHHEEVVKIPPGKKVVVRMTSYRVSTLQAGLHDGVQDLEISLR